MTHRDHIPPKEFLQRLESYRKGSLSRRDFLNVTGLGAAMAVMAGAMPGLSRRAFAQTPIGDRVVIATWPNYHDPADFEAFRLATNAAVDVNVFGSNEEMLAKLQAGGSGWDVVVATNYTISTYAEEGIIEELDLSRIPNFDKLSTDPRFADPGVINGKTYAIPRNIGTTGYCINTADLEGAAPPATWKEFWDLARDQLSGRAMVHDYQLTAIGNALKYFGYSFNSVDPAELAEAEKLLIDAKPHLFAINSDYQPSIRSGDASMSMCWTGDAVQLQRDMPEVAYILGREGGELWSDFFTIPASAPHKDAAYALINFLLEPEMAAKEALFHGYPTGDARADALLPAEMRDSPILFPAADLLNALEFGAAVTLTNPERAEIMARFKAA
ncbi:ABC transporter substrate-binding protein [Pseudogemmobacter faecipullorum]|uniref:Spermidine/putrescine ABC transporter substrate-binding protein n=1 Tax=Pseudogemmobacter faecipullorum TaxID=2755041 RepID=A0ABS8CNI3_9RHOB|nr:spermidine/putrescine ABC transporter substrate-binding protein [Pseudogemmobacter faecipullorum]MCB5410934.1 spermidine/putrescine ABC transporter substrate-binding protein [Pseudogemmobacter faecipullorum]